MSKSIFHDIGNQLLIAKGMAEMAAKHLERMNGLDEASKANFETKLKKTIDAIGKVNELVQQAKLEYLDEGSSLE